MRINAVSLACAVSVLLLACAVRAADFDDGFPLPPPRAASAVTGFTAHGGTWTPNDGELLAGAGDGPKLVCNEPAFANGEAGVEIMLPQKSPGNAALVVKASDCGVGADRFNGYEVALYTDGRLMLGRHRQNFEMIQTVPCDVPLNQWIPLAVKMTDRTLEVFVSGKSILQYEDKEHPLASGQVALRPWQREARYRNLWISTDGVKKQIPFAAPQADNETSRITLDVQALPPIAFFTRHQLSNPNTISCDLWQSRPAKPGCSIRVYDPAKRDAPATVIFSDPDGCIYDMNVSYDARTLFFSYRKKDEAYWHLYRIGVDGSGLKQLTDGPYQDIGPLLLPDGDIFFVSTRHGGFTLCQPGPASNLHRMSPDGSDIRCVSMNTLADFSPQMLPDGRVLFTRWEYVDRDLTYRQSLWTQYPDGSHYELYFGNTVRDVSTFWQARPLPGKCDTVVSTFAPHHGRPHGAIGYITTRFGPEAPRGKGFAYITQEFPQIADTSHEWSYRDPFPITDRTFLVSYGGGGVNRFRIFLLGADDTRQLVYEDPTISCFNALPLRSTPVPPVLAPQPQLLKDNAWGAFLVTDVYRGLEGYVKRGQVKYIRVMEQVRKTEDLVSRAFDQSPVMSYATYYAKKCWGTVPVAEDGSAFFKAPALREIYFQALDADGRELQRMTSGAQVMPGETRGCVGCHESRRSAPPIGDYPIAARRAPVELTPPAYTNDGIVDFPTVVQPVLDKYCVRCHSGGNPDGGILLTGDKTRFFNMAYDNLLGRSKSYRQHDMNTGEMLPAEKARPKPLVHFYWLLRTPTAVNIPLSAGSHASRLLEYIEGKHGEQTIPLADRQRIYLWIDADVPYYGTYSHSHPKSPGRRDLCTDVESGQESRWFAKDFSGTFQRRCESCHGKSPQPNDHGNIWDGRLAWINFSDPKNSPALTAHLPKAAGGRGIEAKAKGQSVGLFKDANDPDYQTMLRAIEEGKAKMLAHPEADMPGFKDRNKTTAAGDK